MSFLARTVTGVLLGLLTVGVGAQTQKKLPISVQKELAEMMQMCKAAGGKLVKSPGLLLIADLTGDGLPDFVIDQASFNCDGAASLFSGSGGSQVSAFVGTQDGQAVQAFASGTFGVKLDKDTQPAKLQIIVGGELYFGKNSLAEVEEAIATH